METLLSVRNLHTQFRTRDGIVKAVDGVSFDIGKGETLGVVGESGCGKSVTALSIMRLVQEPGQVTGEVLFDGQNLLTLPLAEMRHVRGARIAMIFQDPMTSLNPVLTIARQLTEGLQLHLKLNRKQARERAVELLDLVGIPAARARLDDYPHQFSGGMRQRVMIAMALSCNPRLLIADEPTTALDVTIQAQIIDLIKKLTADFGTAVMFISHNLGVVAGLCDRIQVMYAGHIVEAAQTEDLFRAPKHPYTLGLLRSIPRLDQSRRAKLVPIDGLPPDLIRTPPGCPFNPRCTYVEERCQVDRPLLREVNTDHAVACHVDVPVDALAHLPAAS
ncbi:MAG TPA: ABC transporter ATP-binding protein [Chloroflexota bacterium]|nr:ABC transporter ATP-binding protein [Chloroflexota bacterium]